MPSVFGPRISYFDGPDFDTSIIGILQEAYSRLRLSDILLLKDMFPSYLPGGIWFYTTFMTSLWGVLFVLAGGILREGHLAARLLRWATWVLDVKDKPFTSISVMSIGILTILYLLFLPIALLVHK